MRPSLAAIFCRRRLTPARLVAAIAVAGFLAGCASTSQGDAGARKGLFGPRDPNRGVATVQTDYGPDFFLKTGYCPPLQIRANTQMLADYERNHQDEPDHLRYQASIGRTARECHAVDADTLAIKVGIAGRVVAGPKGAVGNVTLPLRIEVVKQHGADVLYTQEFIIPVALTPPDFAADFSQVFDQVVFDVTPDDHDLIVYVGFDQGENPARPTG